MIKLYLLRKRPGWVVVFSHDAPPDFVPRKENFRIKLFAQMYAIRLAKETVARTGNPISLLIMGKDGQWVEERTYPRSADPTGSPG